MFNTVRGKLLVLLSGIAAAAVLLACVSFVLYDRVSYAEKKRATLGVLAESVAGAVYGPTAFGDPDSARYVLHTFAAESTAELAGVYDTEAKPLATWTRAPQDALPETLPSAEKAAQYADGHLVLVQPIEKDGQRVGTLYATFATDDITERLLRFATIAAAVLGVSTIVAVALAFWGQRFFTPQVTALAAAATRVSESKAYDVRVAKISNDELGKLADSFNEMLKAIESRDAQLAEHASGLEATVAARTNDLRQRNEAIRLILDNVEEGLVVINTDGTMALERSASFTRIMGSRSEEGQSFSQTIDRVAPGSGDALQCALEQAFEGFLPIEVSLDQAPKLVHTTEARSLRLAFRAIGSAGEGQRVLAIISDVTEAIRRRDQDARQSQLLSAMKHYRDNSTAFLAAIAEARRLVGEATGGALDRVVLLRVLHTLKGNFSVLALQKLADLCHKLESEAIEEGVLSRASARHLEGAWEDFYEDLGKIVGRIDVPMLQVSRAEYDEVAAAIGPRLAGKAQQIFERWGMDPTRPRLEQLANEVERLARREGKEIQVVIEDEVAYVPQTLKWIWNTMPHLVRNAVDHGLSGAAGTPREPARITLACTRSQREVTFVVADNGKGIDWERIREKGQAAGLPTATPSDLYEALFHDGLSTKDTADATSGRGVGMAAVRQLAREHDATLDIESALGTGTVIRIRTSVAA